MHLPELMKVNPGQALFRTSAQFGIFGHNGPGGEGETMKMDDRIYYVERAEQELDRAQRSGDPDVVRVHYELANNYLDLAYGHFDDVGTEAPAGVAMPKERSIHPSRNPAEALESVSETAAD